MLSGGGGGGGFFVVIALSVIVLFATTTAATALSSGYQDDILILDQADANLDSGSSKLYCFQFTDIPGSPILQGADSFTLPSNRINYTSLLFNFTVSRIKNKDDPTGIMILLMYSSSSRQGSGPGDVFFSTLISESWADTQSLILDQPTQISLSILDGDLSLHDNQTTVFSLENETLLPSNEILWVSFYAIGKRDYDYTGKQNNLYWLTTTAAAAAATTTPGINYFFRDETNILRRELTQWTEGSLVEEKLRLNSSVLNFAWSLTMVTTNKNYNNNTIHNEILDFAQKHTVLVVILSIIGLVFFCIITACLMRCCKKCIRKLAIRRASRKYNRISTEDGDNSNIELSSLEDRRKNLV